MINKKGISKKAFTLALAGGLAFWLANFAISRTSIAADYRAALSISYFPMLLEALVGGLIIGLLVAYFLLRFYDKIPTNDSVLKSVILSVIVLLFVTISIGNPLGFYGTDDVLRYFTIGTIFNLIRILALGIAIGVVCKRKYRGIDLSVFTSKPGRIELETSMEIQSIPRRMSQSSQDNLVR
jgi:branched-subunit amino acid ABC-type transport system permease component